MAVFLWPDEAVLPVADPLAWADSRLSIVLSSERDGDVLLSGEPASPRDAPWTRTLVVQAQHTRRPTQGGYIIQGLVAQPDDEPLPEFRRPIVVRLEPADKRINKGGTVINRVRWYADPAPAATDVAPFRRRVVVLERTRPRTQTPQQQARPARLLVTEPTVIPRNRVVTSRRVNAPDRSTSTINARPPRLFADAPFSMPARVHGLFIGAKRKPTTQAPRVINRIRWFADALYEFRRPILVVRARRAPTRFQPWETFRPQRLFNNDPLPRTHKATASLVRRKPTPTRYVVHKPPVRRFETAGGRCTGHISVVGVADGMTVGMVSGRIYVVGASGKFTHSITDGHLVTVGASGTLVL